jgi:diphthamide biosynthesis protein 7
VPQPSALLDLRFNPHDGSRDICAVVSSTATVALFKLSPDGDEPLKHLNTMNIATMSQGEIEPTPGEEIIFTSFGWHPARPDMMAITTTTGQVYMVQLPTFDGNWELNSEPVITHTLEAWCAVIAPIPAVAARPSEAQETGELSKLSFRVYSGGDDSMLRSRTCTWSDGSLAESLPALEARGHDAGVTAILPLFVQEDGHELVVTGSYDEHIRLFLVPPFGRPKNLAESVLGGGVWRLNLIDLDTTPNQRYRWRARILASCMHAGTRVVELLETVDGEHRFDVLWRFEEHESMNYGSDFQPGQKQGRLLVVSTSFYDKLLCLWEIEMT